MMVDLWGLWKNLNLEKIQIIQISIIFIGVIDILVKSQLNAIYQMRESLILSNIIMEF